MSTTIWVGYRMPSWLLGPFVEAYHVWSMQRLVRYIRTVTRKADTEKCAETLGLNLGTHPHWWNPDTRSAFAETCIRCGALVAVETYKEASCTGSLDVSVNLWVHSGHLYVVPYHPARFTRMDTLVRGFGGTEFAYWDNTDRPSRISQKAWNERRDTWEEVCLKDWNARRLEHVVYRGLISNVQSLWDLCLFLTAGYFPDFPYLVMDASHRLQKEREKKETVLDVKVEDYGIPFDTARETEE